MLLTTNLTALYGQTGNQDTLTCYNNSELKLIAKRVIRANECDTLLILSNALIYVKDSIISTLNLSVSGKDSIIGIIESINNDYSGVITLKSVKKLSRKNKFLKVGWGVSLLAVLVGVLTLSL